jgi:hypothetical protein
MALALTSSARRRRNRQDDPFALYVVDSEGPPLVHVSRTRRCEIVVFGRQQKLLTPIVLGAGAISLNAADNDDKLEISKIVPSAYVDADIKLTSSLELAEVLRRLANLGAGYPEVVSVLETAQRQKNLAGNLVVDAVPIAGSSYLEASLGKNITGKRDDAVKRTSGASSRSPRRRFFGLFGGEPDPPAKARSAAKEDLKAPPEMPPLPDTTPTTGPGGSGGTTGSPAGNNAKNGDSKATSDGKSDDAVERTSGDAPQPRRRLSDFFRKNDDS